jgi:hypothetical protein
MPNGLNDDIYFFLVKIHFNLSYFQVLQIQHLDITIQNHPKSQKVMPIKIVSCYKTWRGKISIAITLMDNDWRS